MKTANAARHLQAKRHRVAGVCMDCGEPIVGLPTMLRDPACKVRADSRRARERRKLKRLNQGK